MLSDRLTRILVVTLWVPGVGPDLQTQVAPAPYTPPEYQLLRQDEDWSSLAGRNKVQGGDFWDPLKYVSLDDAGSVWLSFGGQLRERVEAWNQFNFGAPANAVHSDAYLLSRLFLHADAHFGSHVRLFVQERNSFSTHRALTGGRRTIDVDEADFQNAFLDLSAPLSDSAKLTLRAGIQQLLFDRQLLVGPSDFFNAPRTFFGFSGILRVRKWNVTGFWARPMNVLKYDLNKPNYNFQFFGMDAVGNLPGTRAALDLIWCELRNTNAAYNRSAGRESRHTLGGQIYGPMGRGGLDGLLAGVYQFGAVGIHDISAFMVSDQLGYTFLKRRTTPKVYVGFDYASGDHRKGGNVGTYNMLFPTGHITLGYMDVVGRQNAVDLSTGVSFKPLRKLATALDMNNFWRAESADAFYNKLGTAVRPGLAGSATRLGTELDLTFNYQLDRHTVLGLGYGHFFPGAFIRQTGPHKSIDFVYPGLQYTF